MKRILVSMRIMQWVLAAALIISGLGMLSSCEKFEEANHDILCQWICDRAEEGISARTGLEYNRVVEVYEFFENGTGYYECYLLNGDELLSANYVRGENGNFRYDVKGDLDLRSTVAKKNAHICLDLTIFLLDRSWTPWTVRYADGLITDGEGGVFTPATEAQREQILQLYESRNVAGLSEKIIGKWMFADKNGNPMPTNEIMVITFVSATKAKISASLNAHPEAGIAGPEIVGLDGRRQGPEPYQGMWKHFFWMYVSTPFLSRKAKRRIFDLDYAESASEGKQDKLIGAFMLADTDALVAAGLFDEGTFLYAEENILSERFAAIGKCFWFCPSVRVVHAQGQTIGKRYDARRQSWLQWKSMAYYYRRYKGYSAVSVWMVSMFFRLLLRIR